MKLSQLITRTRIIFISLSSLLVCSLNPAAQESSVRIGALGDYGDGSTAEGDVAAIFDTYNPNIIITLGDARYGNNSFDNTNGQFFCAYIKDAQGGSNCPSGGDSAVNRFFPSPGNHDYDDGNGINEYTNYFTLPGTGVPSTNTSGNERYYDVIQGPVHIFAVDSDSITDRKGDYQAQIAWLQAGLEGFRPRLTIKLCRLGS